ncbi:MAG: hypothetical protein QOJ07_3638, partial [Thermoleophilaceae bacterium]|nr:hypothetical protein [Thermoleophilaceae bacterium]
IVTLEHLRTQKAPYKVTVIAYGTDGYRRISTRRYSKCRKGRPTSHTTGKAGR